MRIIVWDNPPASDARAVTVARLFAERLGDSVELLDPGEGSGATQATAGGEAEPEAASALNSSGGATLRARGGPAVAVERTPLTGAVEDCLPQIAAPERARLAIVPWSDHSAARGWSRSSPAEQMALNAQVPTLVVRDPTPLLEWVRGHRRLRVLCAHDLSPTADDALAFLRQLARIGPCEIVVLHAHRPREVGARFGLKTDSAHDCRLEVRRILERELQERVRRVLGEARAEIRLESTALDRGHAVLELSQRERFDLIVAGTHQRQGIDRLAHPVSLSRALVRSAPTNVLLAPRGRATPPAPSAGIARVLVATDLTWESNQAVPKGYALLPQGGTLRLLHVVHPRALPGGEFDQGISRRASHARHVEVLHACKEQLQALALDEDAAPGVVTEFELVEHPQAAVAIAQAAERFGADVVCMASHRSDGIFGRLFRTHVEAVMAKTNRTLLIIHPTSS